MVSKKISRKINIQVGFDQIKNLDVGSVRKLTKESGTNPMFVEELLKKRKGGKK